MDTDQIAPWELSDFILFAKLVTKEHQEMTNQMRHTANGNKSLKLKCKIKFTAINLKCCRFSHHIFSIHVTCLTKSLLTFLTS